MNFNIDLEEISRFESIASRWWDLEGKCKFLHRINHFRLHYIMECSNGLFGKKVLDIGCGGGILTESMTREGSVVTGLDVSLELLQVARLHAREMGLKVNYVHETAEEHAKKHLRKYHVITCMETLEHVPDPRSIVIACSKMLKPGGNVFFSTINRNRKAWLIAVIGAEYILRVLPKGTHNVKKFIKPVELLSWIDSAALQEKSIIGIRYNPFTDKFKFVPDVCVNYILHATNEDI